MELIGEVLSLMCDYLKPKEHLGKNVGGTFSWWDIGASVWQCAVMTI